MFHRLIRRSIQLACLALSIASAAVVAPARAQESALITEPFTLTPRGAAPVTAELGTLRVPVRHASPQGASLSLRFVRLRALRPSGAEPVVYLAGGPGGSGIAAALGARWSIFDAVRQHVDVILLDQRGTGRSDPPPACPAASQPVWPLDSAFTADRALQALRREAARCAAFWRSQGIDLDAYSTHESAMDIVLLRQALGAERISLWGMSYGTHLALAAMRLHPNGIARVVLMGTEGPDHTLKQPLDADRQLDQLHEWAKQDRAARQLTPDLRRTLDAQLERLARTPIRVRVRGADTPVVIGAFDLQLVVAAMLSRAQFNGLLPVVLGSLEGGDGQLLAQFVVSVREQLLRMQAMPLAMDAASGATAARRALVAQQEQQSVLGRALNFPWPDLAAELGVRDLGDGFRAPLQSEIPALFISGTLDGRTPVANAEDVRRGFAQSAHLILVNAGHDDELWTGAPDVLQQITEFLRGGSASGGRVETSLLRVAAPPGR